MTWDLDLIVSAAEEYDLPGKPLRLIRRATKRMARGESVDTYPTLQAARAALWADRRGVTPIEWNLHR